MFGRRSTALRASPHIGRRTVRQRDSPAGIGDTSSRTPTARSVKGRNGAPRLARPRRVGQRLLTSSGQEAVPPISLSPESSVALLIASDRSAKVDLPKDGPVGIAEVELAVGTLPQHEAREAHLAAGPDYQIRITVPSALVISATRPALIGSSGPPTRNSGPFQRAECRVNDPGDRTPRLGVAERQVKGAVGVAAGDGEAALPVGHARPPPGGSCHRAGARASRTGTCPRGRPPP